MSGLGWAGAGPGCWRMRPCGCPCALLSVCLGPSPVLPGSAHPAARFAPAPAATAPTARLYPTPHLQPPACRLTPDLASRLVPLQPSEQEAVSRAQVLSEQLSAATASSDSTAPQLSQLPVPPGSGPFGTYTPGDVAQLASSLQARVGAVWPQLQQVLALPGAGELVSEVSRALAQRFTARAIKFAFAVGDLRTAPAVAAAAASSARRQ